MKLPNIDAAVVPEEKLREYLLSPTHTIGRYKAAFFRSAGYIEDNWQILASDIRSLLSENASQLDTTEYGTKYAVSGAVTGPNGQEFGLVTVWIILKGEDMPRFVTAYPED